MNSIKCLVVALMLLFSLPAPYPTSGISISFGKPRQNSLVTTLQGPRCLSAAPKEHPLGYLRKVCVVF